MTAMTMADVMRALSVRAKTHPSTRERSAGLGPWGPDVAEQARSLLQREIYGRVPIVSDLRIADRRRIACETSRDSIVAEHLEIEHLSADGPARFGLLLALPGDAPPSAVILAQAFARGPTPLARMERALAGDTVIECRHRLRDAALKVALGRHIHAPPFARILARGVGIAIYCPSELVPDHPVMSRSVIERMSGAVAPQERGGVLAHWAALSIALRAILAGDVRIGSAPIVAWGHSRHGKAALLAAAFEPRFAGVIAHQSGRYGASLTAGGAGETPAQIVKAYPHWFCQRFRDKPGARNANSVDQHHLLALIAPRAILLGNARSDLWADPEGAFCAAHAARDAFNDSNARVQADLARPDFDAAIALFMRAGGHGITRSDWTFFLDFLQAKFAANAARAADNRQRARSEARP